MLHVTQNKLNELFLYMAPRSVLADISVSNLTGYLCKNNLTHVLRIYSNKTTAYMNNTLSHGRGGHILLCLLNDISRILEIYDCMSESWKSCTQRIKRPDYVRKVGMLLKLCIYSF
jgi:hypothetical protein